MINRPLGAAGVYYLGDLLCRQITKAGNSTTE